MKITLDLPALERLLGNDTELETELRNSIVHTFSTKYLKGVLTGEIIKAVINELRGELLAFKQVMKAEIHDKYIETIGGSWNGKFQLTTSAIADLKKQFINELFKDFSIDITTELRELKDRELQRVKDTSEICNKSLKSTLEIKEKELDKLIDEAVKKRFEAFLKQKL